MVEREAATEGRAGRWRTRAARILLFLLAWAGVSPIADAVQEAMPSSRSAGMEQVGTLAIPGSAGTETSRAGWLILNPRTRRAYQVFETAQSTSVQSFDLDTLAPLRRLELNGVPLPTGRKDGVSGVGGTLVSAEVVHTVDEEAGILYLPLSVPFDAVNIAGIAVGQNTSSADARRLVSRYVAIDERALDEGREAVASFAVPPAHARLRTYWLHGLEVDRTRLSTGPEGRRVGGLVLLFAQPQQPSAPVHNHELVRWDVGGDDVLRPDAGDRTSNGQGNPVAATATDGTRVLDVCRTAPLTRPDDFNNNGSGSQWELLVRKSEVVLGCQSAPNIAAVARLELEADGGFPATGAMTVYPLARAAYDVVADRTGGRLFLRTTGEDGETWWVFDANVRRYTGSLAAMLSKSGSMTTGVDHSTGRLYMLTTDHQAIFGGSEVSVRGGLQFADTRLAAPVPFENVRPDLSYPSNFRIRVDPVTRRVFVRRGREPETGCVKYPSTQSTSTCPIEQYYRVLKDTIPVPQQPVDADDSVFTTDVAEAEGLTRASYLGTGSGYGVRTLLVGGFAAATTPAAERSACGKDDRTLVSASAGPVSVSDLSTAAVAASLDADLGTQKVMAAPTRSCWPSGSEAPGDTDELSLDKRDNRKPSESRPDGVNDYEASCVDQDADEPPPVEGRVPRRGFSSEVNCDRAGQQANGQATGAFTMPALPDEPTLGDRWKAVQDAWDAQTAGVAVGKGHSEVKVTRKLGTGIVTAVDSWARGVVIPGVGEIGAVRAEARVEAAGRPGTAKARFERTVCDIDMGNFQHVGCLDLEKDDVIKRLNEAAAGSAEFRLRNPDPKLEKGSRSGYQAGIQRDRLDGFGDRILSRDESLAVPALEILLYRGGGRQIVHLAGADATVSYGIACLYGESADGGCIDSDGSSGLPGGAQTTVGPDGEVITIYEEVEGDDGTAASAPASAGSQEPRIVTLIRRIPELVADAFRLLFANPREVGLMAAVWALLYAPCYLGERRRSIRTLRARRAAVGGA